MISNRILLPIAYLVPFQCFLIAFILRHYAPANTIWMPLGGLAGIIIGVLLAPLEIALLCLLFDRRNPKDASENRHP